MLRDHALQHARYVQTYGMDKAEAYLRMRSLEENLDGELDKPVADKLSEMEKNFEDLCYTMVKANSRLNGNSITVQYLKRLSLYEFFTLKEQLTEDKNPLL